MLMFDEYRDRLGYYGGSDTECMRTQNVMAKEANFTFTRSYRTVIIDGVSYDARIIEDVGDTIKTGNGNFQIEFRDGVLFYPGTYVEIQNAFGKWERWMLIDVLDEFITPKTLIKKCAYEIAWKNRNGDIVKRWICFDDSYKLYDGIRNYGYQTNLPDASLVAIMPADEETINIRRNQRFIIDAPGTQDPPDVWSISNRNIALNYKDGHGTISFSLEQDYFNYETDNAELMIADYYVVPDPVKEEPVPGIARVDIIYNGQSRIVAGTTAKTYKAKFFDEFDRELVNVQPVWEAKILPELEQFFTVEMEGDAISISAQNNENVYNYKLHLVVSSSDGRISKDMAIKVVSGI